MYWLILFVAGFFEIFFGGRFKDDGRIFKTSAKYHNGGWNDSKLFLSVNRAEKNTAVCSLRDMNGGNCPVRHFLFS